MSGKARLNQNSFAAGEVTPRLYGRTDTDRYAAACKTIENFLLMRQGGVTRRPGTTFVAETKYSAKTSTLIAFQFNDQQAYEIETGDLYMRFYRDSGQIVAALTDAVITNGTFTSNITGWTTRNSGTGTAAWEPTNLTMKLHSAAAGNEGRAYQAVAIGAAYRSTLHVLTFRVFAASVILRLGNAIAGSQIKADTTYLKGWHTVEFNPATAATVYVEFESPASTDAEVDDVKLFNNEPVELTTPYTEAQVSALQYDQSADIMWIAHRSQKPRKLLRFGDASWSTIEYTPTTDPFTSATNYPRAVALWKSRLWFGGTDTNPRKVWGSVVDNFESLDPGTSLDDQAVIRTAVGGKVNVIQWFVPSTKELFIGTYGSEMRLIGDTAGLVTPKNVTIVPVTSHGSAAYKPVQAANATFFLQRSRRKMRQIIYDLNTDAYQAIELTTIAEHIVGTGLTQLSYHEDPEPVVWAIRDDGQLVGMSYHPTEKLLGWHRHKTGFNSAGTQRGWFEAVSTIPRQDGTRDQTWVIVKRTVNAATKRFVEYMNDVDGYYKTLNTDCSLTGNFTGSPVSTVSGLTHLIGEEVDIVGDGAVYPRKTVNGSGQVTLDGPTASIVEVGLPYTSTLRTLRPEIQQGTIQGVTVARGPVIVRVVETVAVKVNGTSLPDRSSEDLMDAPPAPFTGDLQVPTLGWSDDAGEVEVVQDLPLPATILLVGGNVTAGDD